MIHLIWITMSILIFIPSVSAINMSSDEYNARFSLGSISLLGDDGSDINLTGNSPSVSGENASEGTGNYDWSWMGFIGPQNLSSFNLSTDNQSFTSTLFESNFVYDSQEDFGWLDCYYLLNDDTNNESTNTTFPCNASNLSITFEDEQWNQLTFFVNDSMSQVFPITYRFWTNSSAYGTPDSGGAGGGAPIPPATVDPETGRLNESGYPAGNPIKKTTNWVIEATKSVINDLGETIYPQSAAVGFLIFTSIILAAGILYKNRYVISSIALDKKIQKKEEKEEESGWAW
ncbi:hypothetical protein KY343_06655 [Candidatus Woesearchaeota archaeon]|nr:hypothetical protein [Candidatus Woesearchaeota archaeon]